MLPIILLVGMITQKKNLLRRFDFQLQLDWSSGFVGGSNKKASQRTKIMINSRSQSNSNYKSHPNLSFLNSFSLSAPPPQQYREIIDTRTVLVLCKYFIVLDTKGLLFSKIYVNIVLFSKQRSFVFQYLYIYCIVVDTKVFCIKYLCKYCIVLNTKVFCF